MNDFPEKLNELCHSIYEEVPDINYGGCGFFAEALVINLHKYKVDTEAQVKLMFQPAYEADIQTGRERIMNQGLNNLHMSDWYLVGIGFHHLVVQTKLYNKEYIVDATGTYNPESYTFHGHKVSPGYFTLEEMRSFLNHKPGWNSMFSRRDVPRIRSKMDGFFKDYFSNR